MSIMSKNALAVLERRYLVRDEFGNPTETVDQLFHRVADSVAAADASFPGKATVAQTAQKFYTMMTQLDFLPNSPTLMNAGRPLGQLSACFVLPVGDSMEEIFDAIKYAALIHKSGGGTGFSFSRLRGRGSTVNSTGGVASGPISFMKVFNAATEAVKQGGTRRGANMGILRVDHPDILDFINCKNDTSEITNFNISVGITEAFMEAVEAGTQYDLINPANKAVVGSLDAKEVFDKVVTSAWQTGEPGIIFLDRLNRDNPCPSQGEIESTNPCGEQPLLPYEACNLGSINLVNHLKQEGGTWVLDKDKLEDTIRTAVHFLDNVIEVNQYPLPEIDVMTRKTRKIGLGVMGFADMLLHMGISYCSDAGVEMGRTVMEMVQTIGHQASQDLATVRGPFPLYEESVFTTPIRNATVTTIAPTGTLSIIGDVSSGVEPIFAYAYIRNVMDNTHLIETNQILKDKLMTEGLYSDALMEKVIEAGSLAHVDGIPQALKDVFVCAHDVAPIWHVKMQAAFQSFTDNAVSKTVNFPNSATKEEVAEVYKLAYTTGCKGTTIYRDGSRNEQVLNIGAVKHQDGTETKTSDLPDHVEQTLAASCDSAACVLRSAPILPRPRPAVTMGYTEKVAIGCGNLYITVNYDENGICEVFTNTGRAGGCPSQSEATARLMSVALRSGVDSKELIQQLRGIRCPSTIRQKGMTVTSCPDAIAKTIEKVIKASQTGAIPPMKLPEVAPSKVEIPTPHAKSILEPNPEMTPAEAKLARYCPECGSPLEHEGGCVTCRSCGYSKCG